MANTKLFSDHNVLDDIQGATNYVNYDSDFDKSYQDLRNYNRGFHYNSNRTKLKILMIPYWVNESFAVVDYDYMKINRYEDVIKFLSEEDRLALLSLKDFPISKEINLLVSNWLMNTWKETAKDNVFPYYESYYNSLIDDYKEIVIDRLSKDNKDTPYRFINTADNIAIVINSCFFNYLKNKDNLLDFFRDLLKEIYTKIPLSMLVKDSEYSAIFRKYLNLIK